MGRALERRELIAPLNRLCFAIFVLWLGGCVSTSDLEKKGPSYEAVYPQQDRDAVMACTKDAFIKLRGGIVAITDGKDKDNSYFIVPIVGPSGPQSVLFVARFYDARALIYGSWSIRGDWGRELLPLIQQCTRQ
jgi:hypothetical protein